MKKIILPTNYILISVFLFLISFSLGLQHSFSQASSLDPTSPATVGLVPDFERTITDSTVTNKQAQANTEIKERELAALEDIIEDNKETRESAKADVERTITNVQDRTQERELAETVEKTIDELNPPANRCLPGLDYDAAVFMVKGDANLGSIIKNAKKDNKITIELIVDNKFDQSLLLLDSLSPFLKGRILVGDTFFPKVFDYNLKQIDTVCLNKDYADKTIQIKSERDTPAIIPQGTNAEGANVDDTTGVSRLNPIFTSCNVEEGESNPTDFSKYKVIGTSKELLRNSNGDFNGKVDVSLKIFVDLNPVEQPSKAPFTVIDDNRIIAAKLITNENDKHKHEIFDFILDDLQTECNNVSFLNQPVDINNDDEIFNPLLGFTRS